MVTKKSLLAYLFLAPLLIGCLLFYGIPLAMVAWYSMKSSPGVKGVFVGLANYSQLLHNDLFRLASYNTFRFFLMGLPLNIIIAYLLALVLKAQAKKHELLKSVLLLPYVMPVVGTLILVEQLFGSDGELSNILKILGPSSNQLMESSYAFYIIILLYLWKNVGYSVILLLAGLMTIPDEQYKAADLDGADSLQKFLYITSPQMWSAVFFALVFAVINGFKCFKEIFLIGGKHPNKSLYMMQHFINNSFENLNYGRLSVASVLLFLVIVILMGLLYAWIRKREAYKE